MAIERSATDRRSLSVTVDIERRQGGDRRKRGRPPRVEGERVKRVSIELSESEHKRAHRFAKKTGRSVSDAFRLNFFEEVSEFEEFLERAGLLDPHIPE